MSKQRNKTTGAPKDGLNTAVPPHEIRLLLNMISSEQHTLNNRFLKDLEQRAFTYFAALSEVQVAIGQIEILFFANGGEKTAAAVGESASKLMAAVNTMEQKINIYAQSPFAKVDRSGIAELVEHCKALRVAANQYAIAPAADRSVVQRRIASTIASIKPYFLKLFASVDNPEERVIAEMLLNRRGNGMSTLEALKDIHQSDPALFLRFFGVASGKDITENTQDRARQLLKRYGGNV